MSRVNRRKHVLKEMLEDNFDLPTAEQQIVRVLSSRGNNLHEVEEPEGNGTFLVSMPCKYRKNIWVKRGDYLLVDPIEEGGKVKAEICKIITPEHVKEFQKAGVWPQKFMRKRAEEPVQSNDDADTETEEDEEEEEHRGFRVCNPNRPQVEEDSTEDEDDDEYEDGEESEEDDAGSANGDQSVASK